MFSLVISNALLTVTEGMVRSAFEPFGEFTLHMSQSISKGNDCLKIFVNFISVTEEGEQLRERLLANNTAQEKGEKFEPVKIHIKTVYGMYRGREQYWIVYLAKNRKLTTQTDVSTQTDASN